MPCAAAYPPDAEKSPTEKAPTKAASGRLGKPVRGSFRHWSRKENRGQSNQKISVDFALFLMQNQSTINAVI